jgi:hypothetical protein
MRVYNGFLWLLMSLSNTQHTAGAKVPEVQAELVEERSTLALFVSQFLDTTNPATGSTV